MNTKIELHTKAEKIDDKLELDHIFNQMGCLSHTSFAARSPCLHLRGTSSSLGNNATTPGRNYKYSTRDRFHYSQAPSHAKGSLMAYNDRVLSHWFLIGKSSHATVGRKTMQ